MEAPQHELVKQNRCRNLEDLAVVQLVPAAVLGPSLQIPVAHALLRSLHTRHFIIVDARSVPHEINTIGRICERQVWDEVVRSPVISRTRRCSEK